MCEKYAHTSPALAWMKHFIVAKNQTVNAYLQGYKCHERKKFFLFHQFLFAFELLLYISMVNIYIFGNPEGSQTNAMGMFTVGAPKIRNIYKQCGKFAN